MNELEFNEDIFNAQKEAEFEVDALEGDAAPLAEQDEALPEVPKLLNLPQSALVQKTYELKQKGKQLDLLLLKAETYSHFIKENQARSQLRLGNQLKQSSQSTPSKASDSGKKKRKSPASSSGEASPSKRKSSAGASSESSDNALEEENLAEGVDSAICIQQPTNLEGGVLLPYQLEGVQWLLSLWENGLSGILADEMGLGKTIQIISLIAHLRLHSTAGPFLIVAPLATIPNWINEFKKWLPSCPVVLYHGSKDDREALRRARLPIGQQKDLSFPVVVTSFEICMLDRKYLERYTWQYLILDEGHRIKNRNCRLMKELKSIQSVSRLLLTGTPIQNTLEELWSLLNFCSPNIFDDLNVFQAWFGFRNIGKDTQVDDIIGNEQQERIVSKLHEILRPFLLRRMKKDVLLKMPPKLEIVVYCGMSMMQREYYLRVQENTIRDSLVAMGIERAQEVSQINMMMNLRKVCNHPFLFGEPKDETGAYIGESNPRILSAVSGKFKLLERMLPILHQQNHKVLIFSQMTELLNILEDFIANLGFDYCRFDGSTKVEDRQSSIDRFNKNPSVFAFLLSTKAGGLGINLTAADTCIIFDSDWNPHGDSQAQDRCHRIGQCRPVVVYRLLTTGSVEIEMLEKQISKKKLERLTIHGGDYRIAGRRAGGQLTLNKLRKLLEDDVKNLGRMSVQPLGLATSSVPALSAEALARIGLASESGSNPSTPKKGSSSNRSTTAKSMRSSGKSTSSAQKNDDSADVITTDDSSITACVDISDEELQRIMDRSLLFPQFVEGRLEVSDLVSSEEGVDKVGPASHCLVSLEGGMYDILQDGLEYGGVLQSLR